jgi:nucleolar protein 58
LMGSKLDLMKTNSLLSKTLHNFKEIQNNFRYGWHFPELGKILTDNIAFIKTIKLVGMRENFNSSELSDILPPDLEEKVKEAAEVSMGTEISEEDIVNISQLCDEIIAIHEYRTHLYDYLKTRMMAIAPNLTVLVGETVGARLIAHAGSLVNLAKHPASTVQILGNLLFITLSNLAALSLNDDTPCHGFAFE